MIRAARLDSALYQEAAKDQKATSQALCVVILGGLCSSGLFGAKGHSPSGLFVSAFGEIVIWLLECTFFLIIGRLFSSKGEIGALMRAVGYAYTPDVFHLLAYVPLLGSMIVWIVYVWELATVVVAVEMSLRLSSGRAVLAVALCNLLLLLFSYSVHYGALWVLSDFMRHGIRPHSAASHAPP